MKPRSQPHSQRLAEAIASNLVPTWPMARCPGGDRLRSDPGAHAACASARPAPDHLSFLAATFASFLMLEVAMAASSMATTLLMRLPSRTSTLVE